MATKSGTASGRESARAGRGGVSASGSGGSNHKTGKGQPLIDLDFVRELIAAVDDSGIDSLEISRAGTRIRVSKTPPAATGSGAASIQTTQAAPVGVAPAAAPVDSGPAAEAASPDAEPATDLHEVKSPMVGTFYRAPAPEAPPYVEPGSPVSKGQTLCILEAMKLMNEMESEVDGVVREVLVENGDPVEYGQVLFRIELTGAGDR